MNERKISFLPYHLVESEQNYLNEIFAICFEPTMTKRL